MVRHEIVSKDQWIEASRALLADEKAWTRERDRLAQKRRALPWVKVEKDYVFEGVELTLTHSGLAGEASVRAHEEGWRSAVDKLERHLSKETGERHGQA